MLHSSHSTSPGAGRLLENDCGSNRIVAAQAGRSSDRRAEGRLAGAAGQNQAQVDLQSTTQALKPPVYLSQRYENVRGSLCASAGQRLTHSCKNAPYSGLCFGRLCGCTAKCNLNIKNNYCHFGQDSSLKHLQNVVWYPGGL